MFLNNMGDLDDSSVNYQACIKKNVESGPFFLILVADITVMDLATVALTVVCHVK